MQFCDSGRNHSVFPGRFDDLFPLESDLNQETFRRSKDLICKAAQNVKAVIYEQCQFPLKRDALGSFTEDLVGHDQKRSRSGSESAKDSCATDVYEKSVAIYRKLRNDIPFLTDAAHDIDAASEAAKSTATGDIPIKLGPLVKRAPPGRGRRKRLSVVNTRLPTHVLKMLQKQRCQLNLMGHPYQPVPMQRPLRVLFVDDSMVTLKMTAQRLQKSGIVVDCTTAGSDALARMDHIMRSGSAPYDIFLADMNMPEMSGPDLARALRQREEMYRQSSGVNTRQFLVGTSTNTDKTSSSLALSSGMDVFLGKPFTPADILLFVSVATNSSPGNNEESVKSCDGEDCCGATCKSEAQLCAPMAASLPEGDKQRGDDVDHRVEELGAERN